jgi:hypothetical protein
MIVHSTHAQELCAICMDKQRTHAFVPCGHVVCVDCSVAIYFGNGGLDRKPASSSTDISPSNSSLPSSAHNNNNNTSAGIRASSSGGKSAGPACSFCSEPIAMPPVKLHLT